MTHGYRILNLILSVPSHKPHVQLVIKIVVRASAVVSNAEARHGG